MGFHFFPGGWMSNGPLSNWIVPYTNGQISSISVSRRERISIEPRLISPTMTRPPQSITGKWAADENGTDILLYGVSTNQNDGQPWLHGFC